MPATDAPRGSGTTLMLRQGEPTQIVVHNRLPFPLSMHWHGLELRSVYDGVGDWSGTPESPRAPIAPGDSRAVLITPPRAGTFMYHTHGEPGHELSQGLYGGFLVLGPNETFDPVRDRLFLLASRGAVRNAPPAINGQEHLPPQRFAPGQSVRLRFAHISEDEVKTVRLLQAGKEVQWRARAKDGADLPAHQRVDETAKFDLGVGETRDVEWTPTQSGVYVLEVRTEFYPEYGGAQIQRVAFAVGDVTDAAMTAAVRGTELPVVDLDAAARERYLGLFRGAARAGASAPDQARVFLNDGQLFVDGSPEGTPKPDIRYLAPLGAHTFAYGRFEDGVIVEADQARRARFVETAGAITAMDISEGGTVVRRLDRVPDVVVPADELDRMAGAWAPPGSTFALVRTERHGEALTLVFPNGRRRPLIPASGTRFLAPSFQPGAVVEFEVDATGAVAISFLSARSAPVQDGAQTIDAPPGLRAARASRTIARGGRPFPLANWSSMAVPDVAFNGRFAVLGLLLLLWAAPAGAQLPRAQANDHRTTAGRMVDGELRVSLEAVTAEWRPRGEDGLVRTAAVFAEAGGVPLAPGPMIRVSAGTPVHVTIRNTLDVPITVSGLGDRTAAPPADAPPGGAAFLRATYIRLEPGQSREVRFTPTEALTSFYRANVQGPPAGRPSGAVFNGVFIVDPAGTPPPGDERVFMISSAGGEGGPSAKVMMNGLSWPFTERLTYTVGDLVRWRIVNVTGDYHPMHLHGFYFNVDARGDGGTETVYAPADRPLVVTDQMPGFSTMRMTWSPSEPGNWLFHCHLIRHMGEPQLFAEDRAAKAAAGHAHASHDMAGLVMGITVRPRPGDVVTEPAPTRRLDVWTSTRAGVFPEGPEHAFQLQDGAVPAPDAARGSGTTLVLRQGEPTQIVVHNRLPFPLSMHWHGLELRSVYDGVGDWSGTPESPRAPIAPGDSRAVLITPPRAGTFMYHTHGEPGHELSQGLYGGFLVLGPNETFDPVRDRLFLLSSRGAVRNAPPAINGQEHLPPQRFAPGQTVRLRFAHISEDERKTVRLLQAGKEVQWRARAKDGADLPAHQRVEEAAKVDLGVGETRDVEWTPVQAGVYLLEVRTRFHPDWGGAQVQRVAFGVGDVTDAAMTTAVRGTDLPVVGLDAASRGRYPGLFRGATQAGASAPDQLRVFITDGQLFVDSSPEGTEKPDIRHLVPLGTHTFAYGRFEDGVIVEADPTRRARFRRDRRGHHGTGGPRGQRGGAALPARR